MEALRGLDLARKERMKARPLDFWTDRTGRYGLYQGFFKFHLEPGQPFKTESVLRSVCDVALLLRTHRDGSLDGVLSHFKPDSVLRIGHAEFFDEWNLPDTPGAHTFAVVLGNHGSLESKEHRVLMDAVTRKNNGRTPDVVMVDKHSISQDTPSDIVFRQEYTPELHTFSQTVQILGSDYKRIFDRRIPRARQIFARSS